MMDIADPLVVDYEFTSFIDPSFFDDSSVLHDHDPDRASLVSALISPAPAPPPPPPPPPSRSPELDYIYHLLFDDLNPLLAEALVENNHDISDAMFINNTFQKTSAPRRPPKVRRQRREEHQQSPAPFDMDAILRAQQEFILKRQLEEDYQGEKHPPKRARKKYQHH